MYEQIEMKVEDSKIISLGFCKCEDCEDEPICSHAHIREGCRTEGTIKELKV